MAELELFVKKLSPTAILPVRGSSRSAGYDLSSAHDVTIPAHGKGIAKTDLAIALPSGTYGRIAPRSGLAWKKHIDVGAGVIDEDYRGNVGVVLFNHAKDDLHIKAGDRVAQLILEKIAIAQVKEVKELDDTARGAGGFGSTGVKRLKTDHNKEETKKEEAKKEEAKKEEAKKEEAKEEEGKTTNKE